MRAVSTYSNISRCRYFERDRTVEKNRWENWKSPVDEWVRSFTIVTTTPNQLCVGIHNRMPVILPPDAWSTWPGADTAEGDQLKSLLVPHVSSMTMWPVEARVGNVMIKIRV